MTAPNLVYILADQLRYASCGYAGDPRARTPHVDALARAGVQFCNAISGHPVCAPYRASLFTGKYSSSTGMVINEIRLSPNHRCLGHVLTEGGYDTAYIGKWHLWANELGHHDETRNAFIPPGPHRLGFDGAGSFDRLEDEAHIVVAAEAVQSGLLTPLLFVAFEEPLG